MRIVSLVPSTTELLADLGLDEELVGLTRFCTLPEGWKRLKTVVGGTKNVDVQRVLALRPDLVVANREENVREQVEAIAAMAEVHVADVATVEDGIAMVRDVGALVGRTAAAGALAAEIEAGFERLDKADPIPAAYLIWRDPYMTVGGDTFISDVMARAGFANVFAHEKRYPEVTPADLRRSGAAVVLLSSEPFPFTAAHTEEISGEVPHATVELVDGQLFSWHGSRMRHMPAYLRNLRTHLAPS